MKIIHLVLGKANPNRMNGVNKVVNSLANYQFDLGYDVQIWGITHTPHDPVPERAFPTRLFPALKHKLWVHKDIAKALQALPPPTVFHIHGGFIPEFFHVHRLLKKQHIPYLHTAHGAYNTVAMQRSRWLKKVYFTLFEKPLLKHAKALHFIGESELLAIQKVMKNEKSILIPNGQQPIPTSISKVRNKIAPIFGFCGRFDIYTKGLDLLLEAFSNFAQHKPFSELWLIGDGPQRAKLEEMAKKLCIEKQVIFWGKKFGHEKKALLQQLDVFFHPSRNEGLPGAVLEAAAMQIPCVVSKESNMGDYIHNFRAGKCLPQNDAAHLLEAMLDMYSIWENPKHYGVIQKNTQLMLRKAFDWKIIAHRMVKTYYQVLDFKPQIS